MKLKIFVILVLASTVSAFGQKTTSKTFTGIESIRLTASSGSGKFVKSSGNEVKVTLEFTYDEDEFEYTMENREGTLVLEEEFIGRNVSGNSYWSLEVPDGVDIRFTSGSGDLEIDGLNVELKSTQGSGSVLLKNTQGDFKLTTGSGDHEVNDHQGDLDLTTGSGKIYASSSSGNLEFVTGSGDMEFKECTGFISATVGSGDITGRGLSLTDGGRFTSGSGNVEVSLTSELTGKISLVSGSGDAVLDFGGKEINAEITMEVNEKRGRIVAPFKFDKEEVIERSGDNNKLRKSVKLGSGKAVVKVISGSGTAEIIK